MVLSVVVGRVFVLFCCWWVCRCLFIVRADCGLSGVGAVFVVGCGWFVVVVDVCC